MVSLAIAETSSPMLNNQPNETISLRDSALWFPNIPETDLQLSVTDVRGFDNASSGFRPLCCLFGDVANPAVLSKVLVALSDNRVVDIHCHYDTKGIRRLSSVSYRASATEDIGYLVKRAAGGGNDTISFVYDRELRGPEVSNFSKDFVSHDSKNCMLRSYRLLSQHGVLICQGGGPLCSAHWRFLPSPA